MFMRFFEEKDSKLFTYIKNTGWIQKVNAIYFLFILGIIPWVEFSTTKNLAGVSLSAILFLTGTLLVLLIYIINLKKYLSLKEVRIQFLKWNKTDLLILAIFIINFLFMIYKIASNVLEYDAQVFIIGLCFFYLLISRIIEFNINYLYIFSLTLVPLAIVYAINYLFHFNLLPFLLPLNDISSDFIAFSLAQVIICSILYCLEKNKIYKRIAFSLVIIYCFCLFLLQNILSLWLGGLMLFVLPLFFWPTAEFVKRNTQIAFAYFFILSNMSLLKTYFLPALENYQYTLTMSIYIDLLIAFGGIFFFNYWDKLPKDSNQDTILMPKIRKWCRHIILGNIILIVTFLTIVIKKEQVIKGASDTFIHTVHWFSKSVIETEGILTAAFDEFGVLGTVAVTVLITQVGILIKKNYNANDKISQICTAASAFYIVYSIFFTQNLIIAPLFISFVIYNICPNTQNYLVKYVMDANKNELLKKQQEIEEEIIKELIHETVVEDQKEIMKEIEEIEKNETIETDEETELNIIDLDDADNL